VTRKFCGFKISEENRQVIWLIDMAPITDEEWADLVAHELPKTSDPVIQKYLESRQALMAEEQKHRSGIISSIST